MNALEVFQAVLLILVAATGTWVALTRDPKRQAIVAGVFALLQSILFYALHSPDVALSELAVGTVAMPALVLLTLAKLEAKK